MTTTDVLSERVKTNTKDINNLGNRLDTTTNEIYNTISRKQELLSNKQDQINQSIERSEKSIQNSLKTKADSKLMIYLVSGCFSVIALLFGYMYTLSRDISNVNYNSTVALTKFTSENGRLLDGVIRRMDVKFAEISIEMKHIKDELNSLNKKDEESK